MATQREVKGVGYRRGQKKGEFKHQKWNFNNLTIKIGDLTINNEGFAIKNRDLQSEMRIQPSTKLGDFIWVSQEREEIPWTNNLQVRYTSKHKGQGDHDNTNGYLIALPWWFLPRTRFPNGYCRYVLHGKTFCNTCRAFNYQFWLVVLAFFGPNHVLALENSNMLGQSPPEFLVDSPNFQPGQLFWLLLFLVVLVSPWDDEQMPVSMSLLTKWTYQSS